MAGNYDPFSAFDYVVSADIIDENPRFADRLQQLKCIAPHAHDDSDEDWPQAVANLHNLESLDLVSSGMWNLSDYPPLPKLRRIRNFDSESERDLEWMAKCSNLEQIEMDDVSIGDEGLKKLLNLKNLKSLSVGGRYGQHEFSEECFALIAQLDSLEELSLKGRFRGDNVEALLRLKKLRSLHLDSPKIRPATLKRLENFGHLTWLGVFCRNVSKNDIEKLQAALPNCKVDGPDR